MMHSLLSRFRAPHHLVWFVFSILILLLSGGLVAAGFWSYRFGVNAWWFLWNFHLTTSIMAAVKTRMGRREDHAYSVDCIWFNFVMAMPYFLFCSRI